jgi:hypothetical protein
MILSPLPESCGLCDFDARLVLESGIHITKRVEQSESRDEKTTFVLLKDVLTFIVCFFLCVVTVTVL